MMQTGDEKMLACNHFVVTAYIPGKEHHIENTHSAFSVQKSVAFIHTFFFTYTAVCYIQCQMKRDSHKKDVACITGAEKSTIT